MMLAHIMHQLPVTEYYKLTKMAEVAGVAPLEVLEEIVEPHIRWIVCEENNKEALDHVIDIINERFYLWTH